MKRGELWVYDIETIVNCFTLTAVPVDGDEQRMFVVSGFRDDRKELLTFVNELHQHGCTMVGFNNKRFDWPVLGFWHEHASNLDPERSASAAYNYAQELIRGNILWFDQAEEWINQQDLFLINHYNNKNRATSLKAVQVATKWHNVQDNLFPHNVPVNENNVDDLLKYNLNDVLSTKHFYFKNLSKIDLRTKLGKKFPKLAKSFRNASDVDIGEKIFLNYLSGAMGRSVKELKELRTNPSDVSVKSIILEEINFKTPAFQELYDKMSRTIIGKDVIEQMLERVSSAQSTQEYLDILDDMELGTKKKAQSQQKKGFSYSVKVKDFRLDYGIGGLHGCIHPGKYTSSDTHMILDIDVASFYPGIAIEYKLHPRHYPKDAFVGVYSSLRDQRIEAKNAGDNVMSDGLKLSLNGVFGKSGDMNSPFYDTRMFAGITINGQLLLSMLIERLLLSEPQIELLQVNTDGITIRIPRDIQPSIMNVCQRWMKYTKLVLEYKEYNIMAIRDVNNYIAVDTKGVVKAKGDFEIPEDRDRDSIWHKDNSFMIVPIAVREYLIKGTPIINTLVMHEDLYDFCGRYKGNSNFSAYYVTMQQDKNGDHYEHRELHGKIFRYIPTVKGGVGIKIRKSDSREFNLLAGRTVEAFSVYHNIDRKLIDQSYFEWQCKKMIETVLIPQTDLFLQ